MSIKEEFESFISTIEENVVEAQQNVAHTVMEELFTHSPHYDPKKGHLGKQGQVIYAQGEYDANHKVSSKDQQRSRHNTPTFSKGVSKAFHNDEAGKINNVSNIGDTIFITNDTAHADKVETGSGWKKAGYATFNKAAHSAKKIHAGVLTV